MTTMDLANAALECLGGLFILNHCRVLWMQQSVRGVSAISIAFFSAWGVWNLFYYPALDQFFSFAASLLVVLANAIYLVLIVLIRRRESKAVLYSRRLGPDGLWRWRL
ncbi:MAG: hypothetical protein REI94_10260 [Moraxellaceae bacterium]|nr:hypothetical protein [Moraxellaceae bacterium]